MIPGYYLRLLCLCLATFVVIHSVAGAGVWLSATAAIHRAQRMRAISAARFLFFLRALPFLAASSVVAALCLPSYLWLEPRGQAEPLGKVCVAAAALGILLWVRAGVRTLNAVVATTQFERLCSRSRTGVSMEAAPAPVVVVDARSPLLALSGIFRSKLYISRGVFEALGPEELGAALKHEDAHRTSRDNLKRLAMLLLPEFLPAGRWFESLEHEWAKFTEWAADDEASGGDESLAMNLASALVRVASLGPGQHPELAASLTACGCGLEARVERLLHSEPARALPGGLGGTARRTGLILAGVFAASVLLLPGAMVYVHALLERLVH